jgi:hypothetical protein
VDFVFRIRLSLKTLIEKRVLTSIAPLYTHPNMDDQTRKYLKYLFPMFVELENGVPSLDGLHVIQPMEPEVTDTAESDDTRTAMIEEAKESIKIFKTAFEGGDFEQIESSSTALVQAFIQLDGPHQPGIDALVELDHKSVKESLIEAAVKLYTQKLQDRKAKMVDMFLKLDHSLGSLDLKLFQHIIL